MIEAILNRWRGTGKIFSISIFNINGAIIYALYLGLLFGLLTTWYIGLLTSIGFLIGESFGWGKWVGSLCYPENTNLQKEYEDKEGYKFPFIHYLANFIIKEKVSYFKYCNLALCFRGMIWGLFLYLALVLFDYLSYLEYIIISIIYGVGFPLSCYLSRKKSFNYKSKFISIVGKWETQEIYYGFIHFICNTYIIFKFL
jgi:hypothetical protein